MAAVDSVSMPKGPVVSEFAFSESDSKDRETLWLRPIGTVAGMNCL